MKMTINFRYFRQTFLFEKKKLRIIYIINIKKEKDNNEKIISLFVILRYDKCDTYLIDTTNSGTTTNSQTNTSGE